MSDEKFIVALIVIIVAVVFVISGAVFLLIKQVKRSKNNTVTPHFSAVKINNSASSAPKPMPAPKIKTVYASPKGQKYHSDPFCFTHDESNCISMTVDQAVKKGLTPCPKCFK